MMTQTTPQTQQICTRCIMDTTDPNIRFDQEGVCQYCRTHDLTLTPEWFAAQQRQLPSLVAQIKADGAKKPYDCIIGVSGGVDSTYVAWLTKKQLGLRPLAVHLDNGWNSELSVSNIEKILKKLDIDLHTVVLDWDEFKSLQVAFLCASTPDAEIPSDHAIFATLFHVASQHKIRYILAGTNAATEGGGTAAWSQGHLDWTYIQAVNRLFGTTKLKTFPHLSIPTRLYHKFFQRLQWIHILNYVDYTKTKAMQVLQEELDWRPYGGKHFESIYTRFFQGYILPTKFNADKRKMHLSSLIRSGQMTREQAIAEIALPAYPSQLFEEDMEFVLKKLNLSEDEFKAIMQAPVKSYLDYPNSYPWQQRLTKAAAYLRHFGKNGNV